MTKVKGDNGRTYEVQTGNKPVVQSLDEKWSLWFSSDPDLREVLTYGDDETEEMPNDYQPTLQSSTGIVKRYICRVLDEQYPHAFLLKDLLQVCLDNTDWSMVARRMCDNFAIDLK